MPRTSSDTVCSFCCATGWLSSTSCSKKGSRAKGSFSSGVLAVSSRDRVKSSPTKASIRVSSLSSLPRYTSCFCGCMCNKPSSACIRASGERISWETWCSRWRSFSTSFCNCTAMRSKCTPKLANSSLRSSSCCETRAFKSPDASRFMPFSKMRIGREILLARI